MVGRVPGSRQMPGLDLRLDEHVAQGQVPLPPGVALDMIHDLRAVVPIVARFCPLPGRWPRRYFTPDCKRGSLGVGPQVLEAEQPLGGHGGSDPLAVLYRNVPMPAPFPSTLRSHFWTRSQRVLRDVQGRHLAAFHRHHLPAHDRGVGRLLRIVRQPPEGLCCAATMKSIARCAGSRSLGSLVMP